MNHETSPELKMKIQNWLVSIEYKQYTQNTNQTLSVDDKESIRRIYSKLGLKPHDLSELTEAGEVFLEKKINEIKNKWKKDAIFVPKINKKLRNNLLKGWQQAIRKTLA